MNPEITDLLAVARDARLEGKQAHYQTLMSQIGERVNSEIKRYDVRVIASDHCQSSYLQYGPSDDRIVLGAEPRQNGSTLAMLIEDLKDDHDSQSDNAPIDLPWSEIEASIREHYRADARFLPTDDDGNDHGTCSEACDEQDSECPFADHNADHGSEASQIYVVITFEITSEWETARDEFCSAHREACLWANTSAYVAENLMPEGDDRDEMIASDEAENGSIDRPEGLSDDDLDDTAREHLDSDALAFFASEASDLMLAHVVYGEPWSQLGHDFALTRAGHGAGFWDRGTGEVGDRLSKASKTYGNIGCMVPLTRDEDGNLIGPERPLTARDFHT